MSLFHALFSAHFMHGAICVPFAVTLSLSGKAIYSLFSRIIYLDTLSMLTSFLFIYLFYKYCQPCYQAVGRSGQLEQSK